MTAVHAALLGVVQGLTEFLPVSSSAHLMLARALFGWEPGEYELAFDVACHAGTLLAVLACFRREVAAMAAAVPDAFRCRPGVAAGRVRNVMVGTLPVIVVGGLFADLITASLRTSTVAAAALALGAGAMVLAERRQPRRRSDTALTAPEALLLGAAQAAALIPGVSRSGGILAVAMLLGVRRECAARFAFLLGIPAVTLAVAREAIALGAAGAPADAVAVCMVGLATSGLVGYLTVTAFIRYLGRHSLYPFAAYRLFVAALVLWTAT